VKREIDARRWPEIQHTFDALVELDLAERDDRLTDLGSSDPELRAAVESLLISDSAAIERLDAFEAQLRPSPATQLDPLGLIDRTITHFRVVELLGMGGIGIVYRAQDLRLNRAVALKFLLPPYSFDEAGKARFLREAHAAAALDHPNLCTIYEIGTSDDGWLFIAMALYAGETLRNRLEREGRLAVPAILLIGRQIALGLQAAHAAGVVHRDLKPGNIMLVPDDDVRILDFGLAKAGDQSVSDSGTILGTASYMAPEQIRGDAVDPRADLWALGVVLHQMLTGRKPFAGEREVAIAHAILHDDVPPFRVDLHDAPLRLKNLILRLLEKDPKDRPQNAGEIVELLDAVNAPGGNTVRLVTTAARKKRRRPQARVLLTSMVAITLVILSAWWKWPSRTASDERLVAVLPFRVGGADPSLRYLREGMIDLLAAKLTGTTRVADARSLLPAWRAAGGGEANDIDRAAAIHLGDKLGAQAVLLGEVTGSGERVTLHASLVNVNGGESRTATVEGRQDSVPVLVDRLAVQLLAFRAGADIRALGDLGQTSFPAIRDYLEGQRLTRLGQYGEAGQHYRAAAKADSNFAAAWFGILDMGWWGAPNGGDTAQRQLVRLRQRLTPAMRAMVDARMGQHYPAFPTIRERYMLAERATQVAREDPYTWQYLGDVLFHWGSAAGLDSAPQRSIAAFERALAIDSSVHMATDHLAWLYYERGDTLATRRWLEAAVGKDSSGRNAYLYLADVVLHDVKSGAQWRAAIRDNLGALEAFAFFAGNLALPLAPLDSVMTAFATRRAVTDGERAWSTWRLAGLAHIRGQPDRQARLMRSVPGLLRDDWPTHILVLEAVLDDADSTLGEQARRALDSGVTSDCLRPMICTWFTAGVYDFMRGNPQTARMALQRFRTHRACWADAPSMCAAFALILDAMVASADSTPDASAKLIEVDSMLRDAPVTLGPLLQAGNLIAARLWERSGDQRRALAAVRRRVRLIGGPELYATYLREEGRLAAATGDSEGAALAYRRYLTLRENAEPSLQPQVIKVRTELARIERPGEMSVRADRPLR
jgi:serine/threonine protein kinase/tetratricopeptide (TPR) repeat protein/TolB-like protein